MKWSRRKKREPRWSSNGEKPCSTMDSWLFFCLHRCTLIYRLWGSLIQQEIHGKLLIINRLLRDLTLRVALGMEKWKLDNCLLAHLAPEISPFNHLFKGRRCLPVQVSMFKTYRTESQKQFASQKHKSQPMTQTWLKFKTKDSKTSDSRIIGLIVATSRESDIPVPNWEPWMSTNEAEVQTPVLAEKREDGTRAGATSCCHRDEGDPGPVTEPMMPAHQLTVACFQ